MAFHDFWNNVRIGTNLYAPEFIAEAPPLDADAIEDMLRKTTHWVTPRSVAGFDETEFAFLPDGEREQLAKLVAVFRQVTSTVYPIAPATADTAGRALPLFRDIIRHLEFDRYENADAFRLGKLLEREIAPWKRLEDSEVLSKTSLERLPPIAFLSFRSLKEQSEPVEA